MSISTKLLTITVLSAIATLALAGCATHDTNSNQESHQYDTVTVEEVAFLNESGELTRIERITHTTETIDGLVPKGAETDKSESKDMYKSEAYSESDREVPFVSDGVYFSGPDQMTFSDGGSINTFVAYAGNDYPVRGDISWSYSFSYDEFATFYNMQFADSSASEINTMVVGNKIGDRIWAEGRFPNAQVTIADPVVKTDTQVAELNRQGVSALEAYDVINGINHDDGTIHRNTGELPPKVPSPKDNGNDLIFADREVISYQYSFACTTITPVFSNVEDIKAAIKDVQNAIGLPESTVDVSLTRSLTVDTAEPCALVPVYAPPF